MMFPFGSVVNTNTSITKTEHLQNRQCIGTAPLLSSTSIFCDNHIAHVENLSTEIIEQPRSNKKSIHRSHEEVHVLSMRVIKLHISRIRVMARQAATDRFGLNALSLNHCQIWWRGFILLVVMNHDQAGKSQPNRQTRPRSLPRPHPIHYFSIVGTW